MQDSTQIEGLKLRGVELSFKTLIYTVAGVGMVASNITMTYLYADHDFLGHHSLFAEPTPASSAAHSCPYMPYFQPLQPSSSSSSSAESVTDGHTFHRWGGLSGPSDIMPSHAFPAVDLHYNSWDHHSLSFAPASSRMNAADQAPVSSAIPRSTRADSDGVPRAGAFTHPFFLGHG